MEAVTCTAAETGRCTGGELERGPLAAPVGARMVYRLHHSPEQLGCCDAPYPHLQPPVPITTLVNISTCFHLRAGSCRVALKCSCLQRLPMLRKEVQVLLTKAQSLPNPMLLHWTTSVQIQVEACSSQPCISGYREMQLLWQLPCTQSNDMASHFCLTKDPQKDIALGWLCPRGACAPP